MPQSTGLQFTARIASLPDDTFAVASFELTETLSEPFSLTLDLASTFSGVDGGEAPSEGVPFFYNAHRDLHRRRRAGEVGWIYTFFWYLYHILTFWTLPNRLVEWENRKIEHQGNKSLPEAMETWSQPLPESEWARPSDELKRLSARLRVLQAANPDRPITALYADLHAEEVRAGRLSA